MVLPWRGRYAGGRMSAFLYVGPWVKAGAFAGLAAISPSDVIVAHYGLAVERPIIYQHIEKPLVYDPIKDRAFWSKQCGHDLTEAEHLEIRSNLVGFMRALMAPRARLQ